MESKKFITLSWMIVLAVAVSVGILALIYALQNPHLLVNLASLGWNGRFFR